jgi:F-type H+-transporting ATPase subunit a
VAAEGFHIKPLEQFDLAPFVTPNHHDWTFTQANLVMVIGAALVLALLYYGSKPRAVVPGRLQAAAEMAYGFIYDMAVDNIGPEGRAFFPFVFVLFFFVLMGNLLGLVPFGFTYTSHIAVTAALAVLVFVLMTVVALQRHGLHFFSYFVPKGVPVALLVLVVPLEIISYLTRPVSLSIRLFGNMVAGHVMLFVLAGFVVMLGTIGGIGYVGAIAPLALNVAFMGFELLVAALQAYVFAILTCIYLHDAVHLH